jgi:hypothetical protein
MAVEDLRSDPGVSYSQVVEALLDAKEIDMAVEGPEGKVSPEHRCQILAPQP